MVHRGERRFVPITTDALPFALLKVDALEDYLAVNGHRKN
jgi:hypothetical protein